MSLLYERVWSKNKAYLTEKRRAIENTQESFYGATSRADTNKINTTHEKCNVM
jgi:hypothetical protein